MYRMLLAGGGVATLQDQLKSANRGVYESAVVARAESLIVAAVRQGADVTRESVRTLIEDPTLPPEDHRLAPLASFVDEQRARARQRFEYECDAWHRYAKRGKVALPMSMIWELFKQLVTDANFKPEDPELQSVVDRLGPFAANAIKTMEILPQVTINEFYPIVSTAFASAPSDSQPHVTRAMIAEILEKLVKCPDYRKWGLAGGDEDLIGMIEEMRLSLVRGDLRESMRFVETDSLMEIMEVLEADVIATLRGILYPVTEQSNEVFGNGV